MRNKYSISNIVSYAFLFAFAVICIVMLAFSTLYAVDYAEYLYPDPDNGFVWLTFDSNIAYGDEWDIASIPLGIISIFQLVFGIVAVLLVVYNFVAKQSKIINSAVIGTGIVFMILYAVEGIVYKYVYCNLMDYETEYFATVSFIPLIIGVVLAIAYALSAKYLPKALAGNVVVEETSVENAAAPHSASMHASTPLAENAIENVVKLKELLDQGILTQEEFDAKKKEILGL